MKYQVGTRLKLRKGVGLEHFNCQEGEIVAVTKAWYFWRADGCQSTTCFKMKSDTHDEFQFCYRTSAMGIKEAFELIPKPVSPPKEKVSRFSNLLT